MKILVYNTHRFSDENSKCTFNRICEYVEKENPDIICFQEVLGIHFNSFKSKLDISGKFLVNVDKINMKYGICNYSKYEIIRSETIKLTSKKEQRGLLNTVIKIDDKILNIINTHLGLDNEERLSQICEIMDYINNLEGRVIICGDFNQKNIGFNNLNDAAIITKKYSEETFYKSKSRIDYVFLDKKIQINSYKVDKVYYSDHYPIILDINVTI